MKKRSKRSIRRRNRALLILMLILLAILLAVVVLLVLTKKGNDETAERLNGDDVATSADAVAALPTEEALVAAATAVAAVPTEVPASSDGTMTITSVPIYTHLDTTEKIICVTVDDCFQAANLKAILDTCEETGARITIFPIGTTLEGEVANQIRRAYEMGMEIENHTYGHAKLYEMSGEQMATQIYGEELNISKVLGVRYKVHFLRTRGGDNRFDRRTQSYIASLGYYGMAHWSFVGSQSTQSEIRAALKPGAIYLFHTIDNDKENLESFIPWAISQGYTLVTLNEMFGLPDNETEPLPADTDPFWTVETPPEYAPTEYITLKETVYEYDVYRLQEKLLTLGYFQYEKPTGVYKEMTADAVYWFQYQHGLTADGVASPEMQVLLFSDAAQEISDSTIKAYEQKSGTTYVDYRK